MNEGEEIIRIAARGDGVTLSGRYAALASPGDALTPSGEVIAGPRHVPQQCSHFPACGGCQLQHLNDEDYAAFVTDRVIHGLSAQGLEAGEIRAPHISPPKTRRRASLRGLKLGKQTLLGFNREKSHQIVDLKDCAILHPDLFALVAPLRQLLATLLPPRRPATVQLTLTDQGVDVFIDGLSAEGLQAMEAIADFAGRYSLARLAIENEYGPQVLWEPEPVTVSFAGTPVPLPLKPFLQATREGEGALVAAVLDAVGEARSVADLFAGIGTFALSLPKDHRIMAAEAGRDAIQALSSGAGRVGRPVDAQHRDLYRRPMTARELAAFDAVILDPPRAGAEAQARELAASAVPTIAYVSCNPASFARDAKILVDGGYRLDWVQPVGQFRWSTHIELASRFSRQ